jgi:hypothetical protein
MAGYRFLERLISSLPHTTEAMGAAPVYYKQHPGVDILDPSTLGPFPRPRSGEA